MPSYHALNFGLPDTANVMCIQYMIIICDAFFGYLPTVTGAEHSAHEIESVHYQINTLRVSESG